MINNNILLERVLLYIKHNLKFIWNFIEVLNGLLFSILYGGAFKNILFATIERNTIPTYNIRVLRSEDLISLRDFIEKQPSKDLKFFKPHGFDEKSIKKVYRNPGFIMMGVFAEEIMVGYFFLRCFWNRKCFVGRLVDKDYQGRGIGKVMNDIMYNIAWEAGFRCFSTISKNNHAVIRAHSKNEVKVVLKELDNDYMLVEFVKKTKGT